MSALSQVSNFLKMHPMAVWGPVSVGVAYAAQRAMQKEAPVGERKESTFWTGTLGVTVLMGSAWQVGRELRTLWTDRTLQGLMRGTRGLTFVAGFSAPLAKDTLEFAKGLYDGEAFAWDLQWRVCQRNMQTELTANENWVLHHPMVSRDMKIALLQQASSAQVETFATSDNIELIKAAGRYPVLQRRLEVFRTYPQRLGELEKTVAKLEQQWDGTQCEWRVTLRKRLNALSAEVQVVKKIANVEDEAQRRKDLSAQLDALELADLGEGVSQLYMVIASRPGFRTDRLAKALRVPLDEEEMDAALRERGLDSEEKIIEWLKEEGDVFERLENMQPLPKPTPGFRERFVNYLSEPLQLAEGGLRTAARRVGQAVYLVAWGGMVYSQARLGPRTFLAGIALGVVERSSYGKELNTAWGFDMYSKFWMERDSGSGECIWLDFAVGVPSAVLAGEQMQSRWLGGRDLSERASQFGERSPLAQARVICSELTMIGVYEAMAIAVTFGYGLLSRSDRVSDLLPYSRCLGSLFVGRAFSHTVWVTGKNQLSPTD